MDIPEKVNLTCPHCGHVWLEPTVNLLNQKSVVYREKKVETVIRRVECPNCDGGVRVKVPKAWLPGDDE